MIDKIIEELEKEAQEEWTGCSEVIAELLSEPEPPNKKCWQ